MSDPHRPEWPDQGTGGYPPNTDPAYSGYWGPHQYGAPGTAGYGAPPTQPTQQLPPYWQGAGYPAPPPPPEPPKKPSRWLWAAAAAAVLLVTGLVLALVIVSNSTKDATVVAPPSSTTTRLPEPITTTPRTRPPSRTTTAMPAPIPIPIPTPEPTEPGLPATEAPAPTGTETVVYAVNGEGRAINITYVDSGGIMQTEFNVALPWSKEVSLAAPAKSSASVAVVNIGRDVTCTLSVNGAQVRQRTGQGLTICTGAG
jgi:hypothetical protein